MKHDSRPYYQTARAQAAAETGERILRAFLVRMENFWFDEIRLDDVAKDAGVTVQTVIRRFGGKEGLLEAGKELMNHDLPSARLVPAGDYERALDAIVAEYESSGNLTVRLLAQEARYPAIKSITNLGRSNHREWVGMIFAPWLDAMSPKDSRRAQDKLVIALDVYVWKLLRVDMQRSVAELRRTMTDLCASALGMPPEALSTKLTIRGEALDD